MKKALFAVLLACAAAPVLAQQQGAAGPPPSRYAPLQDHPSCTREELKRLTAAYTNVEGDPHASCEVGLPAGVLYITHRDYVVDEELGVINVFCRFGGRAESPDSHTFRYIDGRIRAVHTLDISFSSG